MRPASVPWRPGKEGTTQKRRPPASQTRAQSLRKVLEEMQGVRCRGSEARAPPSVQESQVGQRTVQAAILRSLSRERAGFAAVTVTRGAWEVASLAVDTQDGVNAGMKAGQGQDARFPDPGLGPAGGEAPCGRPGRHGECLTLNTCV